METVDITALEQQNKEKKISDVEVIIAILKKCRSMAHDISKDNVQINFGVGNIHNAVKELEKYKESIK